MRRILLSAGVPAGGFASRKKIARRFSEPGPGVPEGVKSYTLCIFLRFFFDFLHIFMLSLFLLEFQ